MKPLVLLHDYAYVASLQVSGLFLTRPKLKHLPGRKTVILLPGVYEKWFFFSTLAATLSQSYNVVYADEIYHSKDVVSDTRALLRYIDDKALNHIIPVGHSKGGITALQCLLQSKKIEKIVAIATPFSGVYNGHLLRTRQIRELLPTAPIIRDIKLIEPKSLKKVVSIYPSYDNQLWSKRGSHIPHAHNIELEAKGHHLILKSRELADTVYQLISASPR